MNVDNQIKNSFSFNIKVLDRDINYKKVKDIFIRKQDIYLIKLLERRAKNNKSINLQPLKKIIPKSNKEKINLKYKTPKVIKLIDYKNIEIRKKSENSIDNNYILENKKDSTKHNDNQFEGLITSRIFNSDSSRNNIKMLNIHKDKYTNLQLYNEIFLKTKNENINNKIPKKIINIKQNAIYAPYETFMKFYKKRDKNYTKCDKKLSNKLNVSTSDNAKIGLDKKTNIKHKRIPIYRNNNFNKINLTDNKNESYFDSKIKRESFFTNSKIIQFHREFNLFKKEKQIRNNKNKIIFDINKKDTRYIGRNNSKTQINYSLNFFK